MERSPSGSGETYSRSQKSEAPAFALAELPTELLYVVTDQLDPNDVFRCRFISRSCYHVFTAPELLKRTLVDHYLMAREVRKLQAIGTVESDLVWRTTFDRVLARYSALKIARPRSVTKVKLPTEAAFGRYQLPGDVSALGQHPIGRWDRYLQTRRPSPTAINDHRLRHKNCEAHEPFWTCDDSGLLVYLDPVCQFYILREVNAQGTLGVRVPFSHKGRIVRRVRLQAGILVFEWAEAEPTHQTNDPGGVVHRHFVTAFDVRATPSGRPHARYSVTYRNEWKLHFWGFPLHSQDLWFSTHTNNHYAAYIWQPNRSIWGENEPIELLLVWDISQPSRYHPSMDPSGLFKPSTGPEIVRKLRYKDLDHLNVRQRDTPTLRRLGLDDNMVYFHEQRSDQECGTHAGRHPLDEQLGPAWERTVGIPIIGFGPPWVNARASDLPHLSCQVLDDHVAGIRYHVTPNQKPRIYMKHKDWHSYIDIEPYGMSPEVCVYADERWLVMECGQELKILHFDHCPGYKGFDSDRNWKPSRPSPLSRSRFVEASTSEMDS